MTNAARLFAMALALAVLVAAWVKCADPPRRDASVTADAGLQAAGADPRVPSGEATVGPQDEPDRQRSDSPSSRPRTRARALPTASFSEDRVAARLARLRVTDDIAAYEIEEEFQHALDKALRREFDGLWQLIAPDRDAAAQNLVVRPYCEAVFLELRSVRTVAQLREMMSGVAAGSDRRAALEQEIDRMNRGELTDDDRRRVVADVRSAEDALLARARSFLTDVEWDAVQRRVRREFAAADGIFLDRESAWFRYELPPDLAAREFSDSFDDLFKVLESERTTAEYDVLADRLASAVRTHVLTSESENRPAAWARAWASVRPLLSQSEWFQLRRIGRYSLPR